MRRETRVRCAPKVECGIPIRSRLVEGDTALVRIFQHMVISIHSLLAEGDRYALWLRSVSKSFNPLPPRGGRLALQLVELGQKVRFNPLPPRGGRLRQPGHGRWPEQFQPTPSSRRETRTCFCAKSSVWFQPTPSSRRETVRLTDGSANDAFQPTPSSRRETPRQLDALIEMMVSTHSLLAEGDVLEAVSVAADGTFQPTPSSRRETVALHVQVYGANAVSTHSLLAEGDWSTHTGRYTRFRFQPTPSSRRETAQLAPESEYPECFNPLPPRGGRRCPSR